MITITRTRIIAAAGLLSAALGGAAAVAVASPASLYDHAPVATVFHGSQPASRDGVPLAAIYEHGRPAQLTSKYERAQPGSQSVRLTAATQAAPDSLYDH